MKNRITNDDSTLKFKQKFKAEEIFNNRHNFVSIKGHDFSKNFYQISKREILNKYSISNINDYIHVQRRILSTIKKDFYTTVVNKASNLHIEITKKGIKETFSYKNFEKTSEIIKLIKIDIIENIKEILENGFMCEKDYNNNNWNVKNYHNQKSSISYCYLYTNVIYNDMPIIMCDIRRSLQKNQFWVHKIIFASKKSRIPSPYRAMGYQIFYSYMYFTMNYGAMSITK